MSEKYIARFDRENGINSIIKTFLNPEATQIFVHDVMSLNNSDAVAAIAPGLKKYCERALVFAGSDDIVFVLDRVDGQFLKFLSDLGIWPSDGKIIVASESVDPPAGAVLSDLLVDNYEELLKTGNLVVPGNRVVLNPFVATPKEFKLAEALEVMLGKKVYTLGGSSDIVDYADGKHNIRAKAVELGVPVVQGDVVKLRSRADGRPADVTPVKVAINKYIEITGNVIIKGAYGSSGSSTIIVGNNSRSIQKALDKLSRKSDNSIYLVEVMLDAIVSPNILMYLEPDNGRILCVGVTDQCLDKDLVHQGNIYPSRAKTLKDMMISARKISKWLHAGGFSGLAGFDFIECIDQEKGQLEHFLADINPRINAATYSKALMERLNIIQEQKGGQRIEAFFSRNVKTKAGAFAEFRELYGHLFFNAETGKGLVPYNTGCLEVGKCTAAFFGETRDEVVGIYETFKKISNTHELS